MKCKICLYLLKLYGFLLWNENNWHFEEQVHTSFFILLNTKEDILKNW